MAARTATVTNIEEKPGTSVAWARKRFTFGLSGVPAGYTVDGTTRKFGGSDVTTNAAGVWSKTFEINDDIDPAGTVYTVQPEGHPELRVSFQLTAVNAGQTVNLRDVLVADPTNPSPLTAGIPLRNPDGSYPPAGTVFQPNGAGGGSWGAIAGVSNAITAYNALGNGTDLNTITTPGQYTRASTAGLPSDPVSALNYPFKTAGTMTVSRDSTTAIVTQSYAVTGQNGGTYTRYFASGAWSPWTIITLRNLGSDSLDNYLMPGFYLQGVSGSATLANNYPIASKTCTMLVFGNGSTSVIQEVRIIGSTLYLGLTYRRELVSGTWSAWVNSTTQQYVDAQIGALSGAAPNPYKSNAKHYQATTILTNNTADGTAPAITSPTTVDLTTATNAGDYFAPPMTVQNLAPFGNMLVSSTGGVSQSLIFGVTTDSSVIRITGSHRLQATTQNLRVFVDGKAIDPSSAVIFPTYTGQQSVIYVAFSGPPRVRNVEIFCRFQFMAVQYSSTATVWTPYKRGLHLPKIALMGDSWFDGTSSALDSISSLIVADLPNRVLVNAQGGSGFTVPGIGVPYTDSTRVGAVAAAAPDLTVLWGSVNDAAHSDGPTTAAAAQSCIDQLLAAKSSMKIILTGPQKPSTAQAAILSSLTTLVASYSNPNITLTDATAFYNTGAVSSPPDDDGNVFTAVADGHPSIYGARAFATWIEGLIQTALYGAPSTGGGGSSLVDNGNGTWTAS